MSLRTLLALPVAVFVGLCIGGVLALSIVGSDFLNISRWSWISFYGSLFALIFIMFYIKQIRSYSKLLLIYPMTIFSIALFGTLPLLKIDNSLIKDNFFPVTVVGFLLIVVFPTIILIRLLCLAWSEIKKRSNNSDEY
tara:strand:+ start:6779 stop:7192 length:414 start_codon:yes stop_codon:yes gene_type:complete